MKENIHYSYELERQILGSIILENTAFGRTYKILDADVFYKSAHQVIYRKIEEMWQNNIPIDLISLCINLCQSGHDKFENYDTAYFLTIVTEKVTSTATLEYHAVLLRQMAHEREVLKITTSGIGDMDSMEAVKKIEDQLLKLRQKVIVDDFKGIDEVLINLYAHMDNVKDKTISGITTGFKYLDKITGGLQPGGMYIIGARPSVGKSAFMGKMVLNAAMKGSKVGIISLEMTDNQIAARIASLASDIDYSRIYRNRMADEQQHEMFYKKAATLSNLPIVISDATGVNISDIKAKIARLKSLEKIDILFIDYLQLLDSDSKNRNYNREQEVSNISRGLKLIAKDYNIPVVVLAQLNRASEQVGDKKPKLHNLRESGSLEQDADGVLFLHRDWMSGIKTNEDNNDTSCEADIIIAKWRDGEVCEYKIGFDGPKMKFYEFDEQIHFKPISDTSF
jgi:replicative DNA helicase